MKIKVYTLTWDARNAASRLGTEVYPTEAARNKAFVEMAESYDIEVEPGDIRGCELSESLIDELALDDIDIILGEHTLEIEA